MNQRTDSIFLPLFEDVEKNDKPLKRLVNLLRLAA